MRKLKMLLLILVCMVCIFNTSFAEVTWSNASSWAVEFLNEAKENELIPEVLNGENLKAHINRREFAALAVKLYEGLTGSVVEDFGENPFIDTADEEIIKAYHLGITSGTSATTFSPEMLLTREQAATMLTNVIRLTKKDIEIDAAGVDVFADDANISSWAKPSVYFMAKHGIITGMGGNLFAPKNVTKAEEESRYANATREQAMIIAVKSFREFRKVEEVIENTDDLGKLEIHFIDVGQADSILIIEDDVAMLIDAGNNADGSMVVDYLQENGVEELAYLIGTHPHEDHIGGLDDVINHMSIETLLMPRVMHTTKTFEDVLDAMEENDLLVTTPEVGDTYRLDDAEFTILSCRNEENLDELNLASVVVRLEFGETSYLFCGDAEVENEEEMLDSSLTLKSDVIKIGHHGSTTSSSEEFIDEVDPEYAVIMCGEDNSYGHPHDEVLELLEDKGIKLFRTDLQGTIVVTSDGESLEWNTRPSEYEEKQEYEGESVSAAYILNTNTKKFHEVNCGSVSKMKASNRKKYSGTREELLDMGYSPCGNCKP